MRDDVVLCGTGGQGTVLASKLLATAAMQHGLPVKTAETIGMAQRGGSVFSHVRIGEGVSCPLVGEGRADLVVAFEPAEAVRQLRYLRPGGAVVVSNRPIVPVSAMTGGPTYDVGAIMGYLELADAVARECRSRIGFTSLVKVVELGVLPRSEKKTKRVFDERYE